MCAHDIRPTLQCRKNTASCSYYTHIFGVDFDLFGTMRHNMEPDMRQETLNMNKLHTSYGKLQTMLSCWFPWKRMQSRSIPSCGLLRKLGRLQVFDRLCAVHVRKFYFGSDLVFFFSKKNSGAHSSTEAEIVPMTDWRMRFPFRQSPLVFKSAVVGTAHSGIGVFVMTEAERKRDDARRGAECSRTDQSQDT